MVSMIESDRIMCSNYDEHPLSHQDFQFDFQFVLTKKILPNLSGDLCGSGAVGQYLALQCHTALAPESQGTGMGWHKPWKFGPFGPMAPRGYPQKFLVVDHRKSRRMMTGGTPLF